MAVIQSFSLYFYKVFIPSYQAAYTNLERQRALTRVKGHLIEQKTS